MVIFHVFEFVILVLYFRKHLQTPLHWHRSVSCAITVVTLAYDACVEEDFRPSVRIDTARRSGRPEQVRTYEGTAGPWPLH